MGFIVRPSAWQMRQAREGFAGRPQVAANGAQFSRVRPGRLALITRPAALPAGRLTQITRPAALQTGQLAMAGRPGALQAGQPSFTFRPTPWEIEHAQGIFAGQIFQAQNGGMLPDTPMWRLLEARYNLNAERFAYFHPNVADMIEQKLMPPPEPPITPPPPTVIPPPPPEPPITPPPPIVIPPPVGPPPITPPVDPPTDPPVDPPPGGQITDPPPDPGIPGVVPEPSGFAMLLVASVVLGVFCLKGRRWFGLRSLLSRSPVS